MDYYLFEISLTRLRKKKFQVAMNEQKKNSPSQTLQSLLAEAVTNTHRRFLALTEDKGGKDLIESLYK